MTASLCLVRHGQTSWNFEKRIQGSVDQPLNEVGIRQASDKALELEDARISKIYSSPLLRAFQTACIIAERLHVQVEVVPQLHERKFGKFEGMTVEEISSTYFEDYQRYKERDVEFDFSGTGESLSALSQRVHKVLTEISMACSDHKALVVTHGGVIDAAFRLAHKIPFQARRQAPMPNLFSFWLKCYEGRITPLPCIRGADGGTSKAYDCQYKLE